MIPDLQASLLCDDVRQERNGKFILIGIFDGLMVPQVPFGLPRLCIVNRWCCGQGRFQQQTRLVGPDMDRVLMEGKRIELILENDQRVYTSIEIFVNVQFSQTGSYWVEVLLDTQLKLRYPFHVRPVKPGDAGSRA